jgi:hypothetical protein
MMAKNDLREGSRGCIIISAPSHLLKPFANTHRNQDCLNTIHGNNYFIRNLAPNIERETINDNTLAEKLDHNSIFE